MTERREASPDQIERVRSKLTGMPGWKIFGSRTHRGRLGPPLPEGEVADFERRHGIVLPHEYRTFVTQVGNGGPGPYGGAGPFHGLLPLDRWDEALTGAAHDDPLKKPFPVPPGRRFGADWVSESGLTDDDEWFPGAVALAHVGCGNMAVLVVTGPGRGRVAYTCWDDEAPDYSRDPHFLAWYERWLDAAARGDSYWS